MGVIESGGWAINVHGGIDFEEKKIRVRPKYSIGLSDLNNIIHSHPGLTPWADLAPLGLILALWANFVDSKLLRV